MLSAALTQARRDWPAADAKSPALKTADNSNGQRASLTSKYLRFGRDFVFDRLVSFHYKAGSAMASSATQPTSSPDTQIAHSRSREQLRLPAIDRLPPLSMPPNFSMSALDTQLITVPPAIPPRYRPPPAIVNTEDEHPPDVIPPPSRQRSIDFRSRQRAGSSHDSHLHTERVPAVMTTPQRPRQSSLANSVVSNSSPSSSPFPSPSSNGEPLERSLSSSSPLADSPASTASGSSGYYFSSSNGSKKQHHRRNLAIMKNSISANYTAVEAPPPRSSVRKSYFSTSFEPIMPSKKRDTTIEGEAIAKSESGIIHGQENRTEAIPGRQSADANSVESKSGSDDYASTVPLTSARTNPTNPPNLSSKRESKLVLGFSSLSRLSRSSPDLHGQYLAAGGTVSEADLVPVPSVPAQSVLGSSESMSGSSTSSKQHTLKSQRSMPRLRNFARRAGTAAKNAAMGPRRISRSVSPLYRVGADFAVSETLDSLSMPPPLPPLFRSTMKESEGTGGKETISVVQCDNDASASSTASTGALTPDTPITPTSSHSASQHTSDETVVLSPVEIGDVLEPAGNVTPADSPAVDEGAEKFLTPRSSIVRASTEAYNVIERSDSINTNVTAKSNSSNTTSASDATLRPSFTDGDLKREWKRIYLIRELLDTETVYLADLTIIKKYYKSSASAQSFISKDDIAVIFQNLDSVIEFTQQFCSGLQSAGAAVMGQDEHKLSDGDMSVLQERESYIGDIFLQAVTQLESVYQQYCHSHERSISRLNRLMSNNPTQMTKWLDSCHQASRQHTNAWNLESLLIKPVQRLMKYPLILKSLAECTAPSHPDKRSLEAAAVAVQAITDRTNNAKRGTVTGDTTTSDIKRGVTRGFVRSTEKLKQSVGMTERYEVTDRSYDVLADRFRRRHMELRVVLESFNSSFQAILASTEKLHVLATSFEVWLKLPVARVSASSSPSLNQATSFPATGSHWRELRRATSDIREHDLVSLKSAVANHVMGPLEAVLELFERSQKSMTKRERKVPDYRRYASLRERGIAPDKSTTALAESYLTLNSSIVKEIPKFLKLVDEMVTVITSNWIEIQTRWNRNCTKRLRESCVKTLAGISDADKITIDDIELAFLLQSSSFEDSLKPLGICNGDLRHYLLALEADAEINSAGSASSTPSMRYASSPSLGSKQSKSKTPKLASTAPPTPKIRTSEFGHSSTTLNSAPFSSGKGLGIQTRSTSSPFNPTQTSSTSSLQSALAGPPVRSFSGANRSMGSSSSTPSLPNSRTRF